MNIFKKIIAVTLTAVMVFGILPPVERKLGLTDDSGVGLEPVAAAFTQYNDINNHWAAVDINIWNSLGFIDDEVFTGPGFQPDRHITRVEFFSLITRSMGASTLRDDFLSAGASPFTDVNPLPENLYNIVGLACQMGIANGYGDGTMRPNSNLLRQDAFTLAARALGMSSIADWNLSRFNDGAFVAAYAKPYVTAFLEKGMLSGFPDGTIRPNGLLTRAEAVRVLSNIFSNVHLPEAGGFHDVHIQGGLLIQSAGAELRNVIIDGDVTIADGVGDGNVIIADSTINGRLIVRGGGVDTNGLTISNTEVTRGMYVASHTYDTRIAVTDNSTVPVLDSISGLTLSGGGVRALNILENARQNVTVGLNGVSLDDLNINGNNAQVNLISGHVINVRFDEAAQYAGMHLSPGTTISQLVIAAPNVSVTGEGVIKNALVNNADAVIEPMPELLTVGLNLIALVAGEHIHGVKSQWPNDMVDRISAASTLKVELLANRDGKAYFDQSHLRLSMGAGSAAGEARVSQAAALHIPLTQHGPRWGYWIGFFVPAPTDSGVVAGVTYTHTDGEPITLPPRPLDQYNGRHGLLIYLPVIREQNKETGAVNELLHINWGGHLTENLHFMSTTLHLTPPNASQQATMQDEFNKRTFHSIHLGALTYTGAEATRRYLNSDNPLGLPFSSNLGLDALNRALTSSQVVSILLDRNSSLDLTIDTSGNSPFLRLSDIGQAWVADQILAARRSPFMTAAAVKAIFDRSVNARLALETTLLASINNSADFAALRTVIELAGNAATLGFYTGSDPYRNFNNRQRDDMARHLWGLREYQTLQKFIDELNKYLMEHGVPGTPGDGEFDIRDLEIAGITVSPPSVTFASGATAHLSLTINLRNRTLTPEQNRALVEQLFQSEALTYAWRTGATASVTSRNMNVINVLCTHDGVSTQNRTDTLTFSLVDGTGRTHTRAVNFTAEIVRPLTNITLPARLDVIVGESEMLVPTRTPANSNEPLRWTALPLDGSIATVEGSTNNAVVSGVTPGRAEVRVEGIFSGRSASSAIWVFQSQDHVLLHPSPVFVRVGSEVPVDAMYYNNIVRSTTWSSQDTSIATVSQEGTRGFVRGVTPGTTIVTVRIDGSAQASTLTVHVLSDSDFGITSRLSNSIVNSGGSVTMRMSAENPDAAAQLKLYPVVDPVTVATIPPGPYTIEDVITITALANGAGPARILLYDSDPRAGALGEPISIQQIRVSPESVGGLTFNYTGPSQSGTISLDGAHTDVVPMIIDETVTVTAMRNGAPYTGVMTWHAFSANYYREILHDVRTDDSGFIISKFGGLLDIGSGPISFADVFNQTSGAMPDDAGTASLGYHNFVSTGNVAEYAQRVELLRRADSTMVRSNELSAVNGRITNIADRTGLYSVFVTPERNLPMPQVPEWGTLFFRENIYLFEGDGSFNPIISPSSGFEVQRRTRTYDAVENTFSPWSDWSYVLNDPTRTQNLATLNRNGNFIEFAADAPGLTGPNGTLEYQIVDVNGEPISNTAPIRAIVDEDQYAEHNYFYVHLRPRPVAFRNTQQTITEPLIHWNENSHLDAVYRYEVVQGSHRGENYYGFEGKEDPPGSGNYMPAPAFTAEMTLFPQRFQGGVGGVEREVTLDWFMGGYQLNLDAGPILRNPPPPPGPEGYHPYVFVIGVQQNGNNGFAARGSDTSRIRYEDTYTHQLTVVIPVVYTAATIPVATIWEYNTGIGAVPVRPSAALNTIDEARAAIIAAGINLAEATFTSDNPSVISITSPGGVFTVHTHGNARITIREGTRVASVDFVISQVFEVAADAESLPLINRPHVIDAARNAGVPLNAQTLFSTASGTENIFRIDLGTADNATTAFIQGVAPGVDDLIISHPSVSQTASIRVRVLPAASIPINPMGGIIGIDGFSFAPSQADDKDGAESAEGVENAEGEAAQEPPKPPPTAVSLRATASAAVGKTLRLEPFVTPFNADREMLRWTSSDPAIATVSPTGIVTGIKAGTVTITVANSFGTFRAQCKVTVRNETLPVASIAVAKPEVTLNVGASTAVNVRYTPSNASIRSVTWVSNNSSVARVEPNGKIVGVSAGTAWITAISDSGGHSATIVVNVKLPVVSVAFPEKAITLKVGETYQITPIITPIDATNTAAIYAARTASVASVSAEGLVTANKPGKTVITVRIDGKSAALNVTVTRG